MKYKYFKRVLFFIGIGFMTSPELQRVLDYNKYKLSRITSSVAPVLFIITMPQL